MNSKNSETVQFEPLYEQLARLIMMMVMMEVVAVKVITTIENGLSHLRCLASKEWKKEKK